jgi:hypothetical protein
MSRLPRVRLLVDWTNLPGTNRLSVVHALGQILVRRFLDADGREVGREDT